MSDHNLAEALRPLFEKAFMSYYTNGAHLLERFDTGHYRSQEAQAAWRIAREFGKALAAHSPKPASGTSEQQAGEAVAIVELKTCGGNAGLSTRIKEIEDPMRDRLTAGTKLFTHPQQPLTEEQIRLERKRIDPMAEDMDAWSFKQGVRFAERAHGITKDTK